MRTFLAQISWESEVWVADDPDHLIHFDGERFLVHIRTPCHRRRTATLLFCGCPAGWQFLDFGVACPLRFCLGQRVDYSSTLRSVDALPTIHCSLPSSSRFPLDERLLQVHSSYRISLRFGLCGAGILPAFLLSGLGSNLQALSQQRFRTKLPRCTIVVPSSADPLAATFAKMPVTADSKRLMQTANSFSCNVYRKIGGGSEEWHSQSWLCSLTAQPVAARVLGVGDDFLKKRERSVLSLTPPQLPSEGLFCGGQANRNS